MLFMFVLIIVMLYRCLGCGWLWGEEGLKMGGLEEIGFGGIG